MCLHIFPPSCRFYKSARNKLPICASRNPPPSLQILWNLPLDSLLSYLYVLAEILPTPGLQILWNLATGQFAKLPTCTSRNFPHQFSDFVKSATGQIAKLPICACRNFHPSLQILWNLPLDRLPKLPSLQILWNLLLDLQLNVPPPLLQILWNLPTGQFAKLPICACRNSPHPSLQILWNLPLDSLLSYLYVLAEIPPQFADFVKSATGQFAKLPTPLQMCWTVC